MAIKKVMAQPSKSGGVEVFVTGDGYYGSDEYRFTYGPDGQLLRDAGKANADWRAVNSSSTEPAPEQNSTVNATVHDYLVKYRADRVYDVYVDGKWVASKGSQESVCQLLSELFSENL